MPYAIEPQRDWFKLHPDEAPDAESTWFVPCGDEDAEQFAVFRIGGPEPEFVADFPTREKAAEFIAAQDDSA
jgi:hypothetical protein